MNCGIKYRKYKAGYTLFEVLAVLLLIGIISTVVMSRDSMFHGSLKSEAEVMKAHLRYVQYLALSNDLHGWRLEFNENSYTLFRNNSSGTIKLPNETSATHVLPPGVQVKVFSAEENAQNQIEYDRWGSPKSNTAYTVELTDTQSGKTETFSVAKDTGFIP